MARGRYLKVRPFLSSTHTLKLQNSNKSCFEAHASLFRLSMKGIFDAYVLCVIFWQKNNMH
jgi:hypothetical protein